MKRFIISLGAILSLVACGENNNSSETATTEKTENEVASAENESQTEVPDPISAETNDAYSFEIVVGDLSIPWGFTFLPDNSLLINEKDGSIVHYKNGTKTQVKGGPEVYNRGQGGLLDVALHPDYNTNGWIYFTYASPEGDGEGGNTAIMRARLKNSELIDQKVLYKATPNTTKGQHFGSRIVFDKSGHLYFSAGDRGARDENPQDITRDNGKVYRLNDDGTVPADNPYVDNSNAVKAIFSYGHRNPQGMILNPDTDEVWVHEHGPKGGDEINVVKKGANYGWPVVTYGENYDGTPITDQRSKPNMEDPIFYWLPSIAPSGFAYVTSDKYPELKGDLLVGSLKFQYLEHLSLEGKQIKKREKILEGIGRVRDVKQGPDGHVYLAVEGKGIVKLNKK